MLALLGVLVMVGFVILPAIMQGMGQQSRANPRVVTTKNYGDLHSSNLAGLRWRRQIALRFFDALGRALVMAGANPAPVQMAVREMVPDQGVSPISDEALVETWLLARRAEELGLVVDNATISAFIRELMQDRITPDGLAAILQRADISDNELLSVLRQELLAMRLRGIFRLSVQGTTPAERWDYFQRLNRKVTIESLEVPVSRFLDDVDDPDEATLRDFFEEYKAEPYDPASPEPGFREPKKVAVEYLKAEYESFFQRELAAVSPEELKAYYEEHKGEYREESLPAPDGEEPAAVDSEAKAEEGESAAPESSGKPEDPASQDAAPDQEMPAGEAGTETPEAEPAPTTPDGEAASAPEKPAEAEPENTEPANTEPADTKPAEEASPGSTGAADDTSSTAGASPFRLASFLAEDAAPEETAAEEGPSASSEEPSVELAPADGAAAEPTPPQESMAETMPADEPAEQAEAAPEEPAGEEGKPSAEPAAATPEEGDVAAGEPKYLPLEKVEEEIRNKLARDKANEAIVKVLADLRSQLERDHEKLILFEVESKNDPGKTAPEKTDFDELAEQHDGLDHYTTELFSALDAEQLDGIVKSSVGQQTSFIDAVFELLPKQRPEISQDTDGNHYLFWKVDEAEERVPELEDAGVRERVVREWKKRAARILARQEAEQMAAKAREAGKPLAEALPARSSDVVPSEPFTWLTYGAIQPWMAYAPPSVSAVEGVDTPGDDFMRAVFTLKKKEVGAAMNQPQTVAYVVRLTDSNPLDKVLWTEFTAPGSYYSYFRAAWHDQSSAEKAWLDGIKKEVGFAWDPAWQRETAQR
ncbi:MAG: hypothetical protein ABIP48_12315 [Planctomycetota bacterium]